MRMVQLRPKCDGRRHIWTSIHVMYQSPIRAQEWDSDDSVSDERDKVEEKSHVKQAFNINGYPD